MTDAIRLAQDLIAAPSVTPATGAVFDVLESALLSLGFEVERFVCGDPPDGPVEKAQEPVRIWHLRGIWTLSRPVPAGQVTLSGPKSAATCSMGGVLLI